MHSHVQQAFTILFCIELAINMFAKSRNHFKPFYSDNWNLFDFFVVFMYLSAPIHTCFDALAHTPNDHRAVAGANVHGQRVLGGWGNVRAR